MFIIILLYKNKSGRQSLHVAKLFKHLRIHLRPSGIAFGIHVKGRAIAASRPKYDVRNLDLLSLETALTLLDLKIVPVFTCHRAFLGPFNRK
jgi:hypothetical protein